MIQKSLNISQLDLLLHEAGIIHWNAVNAESVDEKYWTFFTQWRQKGYHADMQWIEKNDTLRRYPELLHPGTKTIICFLVPYFQPLPDTFTQSFSIYITKKDYHKIIKKRLKPALSLLKSDSAEFKPRVFVDSAPIAERYWAWKAGLGFIGKNGLLIHPRWGSYFFIGSIFTDIPFKEKPLKSLDRLCGKCRKCMEACPTGAIVAPAEIDSRLCISYHTIESKDTAPTIISNINSSYVAGCDICQRVCPYNQKPLISKISDFIYSKEDLKRFQHMKNIFENKEEFENCLGQSAAKRAGYERILSFYHMIQNNVK